MATLIMLVDGTVPVSADFNTNFTNLNTEVRAAAVGGTGLAAGSSGGLLYYSAAATLASSAALTQYSLLTGGGAGAAPVALGAATNGQLAIGSTGVAMVLAALTAGAGITVTNAAGAITLARTAPVLGTFTRDMTAASGTQAVTTTGITPRYIVFLAGIDATSSGQNSIGFSNSTVNYCLVDDRQSSANQNFVDVDDCIHIVVGASVTYQGDVSALAAGSFTVNWTRTGAPTGTMTVAFMAFP